MIRRPLLCFALCWATFCAAVAQAQPPAHPTAHRTQYPLWNQMSRTYLQQTTIVHGRIANTIWQRFGIWTSRGTGEELRVQWNNGIFSIRYERTSEDDPLLLEAASDGRFSIRRDSKGKPSQPPLLFNQPSVGPISLRLGKEGEEKVYRAASLWHLAIVQPEACKQHLFPLLANLPGCTQLPQTTAAIEAELLRAAAAGKSPDYRQWGDLVRQLGDNQFAKREAADRLLRAAGPAVAGYLQQLDYAQLDAEQQFRVQRILGSFRGQSSSDTPAQVAVRLMADAPIWLALLDRPEVATRRMAAKQLAGLLGGPIGVDPEADPATQAGQREQLRAKIEPHPAETKTSPKP